MSEEELKNQESLISEFTFNLILDSEESEDFGFNMHYIDATGTDSITHINKETILCFLQDFRTKVFIQSDPNNPNNKYLVATNMMSKESIRIYGLADHYLTLLDVVDKANKTRRQIKHGENPKLLSHQFIKDINLSLQRDREDNQGIGEYRHITENNESMEVRLRSKWPFREIAVSSVGLAKCNEVEAKMTELIDWVNNVAFKEDRDFMHDLAEFHARFIKIHPFRDGNGRTGRLLNNYILLSHGKPIITIPADQKKEYMDALDFANSDDIELSSEEIFNFRDWLQYKYGDVFMYSYGSRAYQEIEERRQNGDRYKYLVEYLKSHQLNLSYKEAIAEILNNYGIRNIGARKEEIGHISVDIMDYTPVPEQI